MSIKFSTHEIAVYQRYAVRSVKKCPSGNFGGKDKFIGDFYGFEKPHVDNVQWQIVVHLVKIIGMKGIAERKILTGGWEVALVEVVEHTFEEIIDIKLVV